MTPRDARGGPYLPGSIGSQVCVVRACRAGPLPMAGMRLAWLARTLIRPTANSSEKLQRIVARRSLERLHFVQTLEPLPDNRAVT